jgi:hypothetical protein
VARLYGESKVQFNNMNIIKIERSKLRFYFIVIVALLFYCGMGILIFAEHSKKGNMVETDYLWLLIGCVFIFMAFYTIVFYFKNSPTIEVDQNQISFNTQSFNWTEIEKIDLTGKQPFKYLFGFPIEGAMLQLKNGQVKYFFDDMYSNTWKVKSFIQQVIINKKENAEILTQQIEANDVRLEEFIIFKGNQFTSLRGIMLWGFVGFFVYIIYSINQFPGFPLLLIIGSFCTFWFLFSSYLMNYFALSDKFFAVRNHNYFWKNEIYKIQDIKEIVFESQGKMPNRLRIITIDFRYKMYPAGTLRNKTWFDLKDKLELKGIKVRDELNILT